MTKWKRSDKRILAMDTFSDFELGVDAYMSNKPFDEKQSLEWSRGWHSAEDDKFLRDGEKSDHLTEWGIIFMRADMN